MDLNDWQELLEEEDFDEKARETRRTMAAVGLLEECSKEEDIEMKYLTRSWHEDNIEEELMLNLNLSGATEADSPRPSSRPSHRNRKHLISTMLKHQPLLLGESPASVRSSDGSGSCSYAGSAIMLSDAESDRPTCSWAGTGDSYWSLDSGLEVRFESAQYMSLKLIKLKKTN